MPHGIMHRRPRQVCWRASWYEISLVVGCRSPSSYAAPITRAKSYRGFHMLDLCDRIVEYALPQNSAPSSRLTSKPTGAKHDTSEGRDSQSKIEASLGPTQLIAVFCYQHILTIHWIRAVSDFCSISLILSRTRQKY